MTDLSGIADNTGHSSRDCIVSAAVAVGVGLLMLFTIGFAPVGAIHDAAHDGRHVFSFPCH